MPASKRTNVQEESFPRIDVDESTHEYCVDSTSLVRFDPSDLKQGGMYFLRLVGWPTGYSLRNKFGPPGNVFMKADKCNEMQVIELPSIVRTFAHDNPDMIAVAFRIHGSMQRLSVLCVPADLRIDKNKWVSKEDWRYHRLQSLKHFSFAGSAMKGSNFRASIQEYLKAHCELYKGGIGLPKSIEDCSNWLQMAWKDKVEKVVNSAERELRAGIALDSGAKKTTGKGKSKAAADVREVVSEELTERLQFLSNVKANFLQQDVFYSKALKDRTHKLTDAEIKKLPLPTRTAAETALHATTCPLQWKIGTVKRLKDIWELLLEGSCCPIAPSSPTLRAQLVKATEPSIEPLELPLSIEAQVPETAPAPAAAAAPEDEANANGDSDQDQELESEQDDEVHVVEQEEPLTQPPETTETESEAKRLKKAPLLYSPPHKVTKAKRNNKDSPGRAGDSKRTKTGTVGKRTYNRGDAWYARYPKQEPGSVSSKANKDSKPAVRRSPTKPKGICCLVKPCSIPL